MRALKAMVAGGGFDCGFAFDGDGDRCLAVDENGNIVDGDHEIAILACDLLANGRLPESKVVTTVMTNYGFHEMAKANGLNVHVSDVGDRNVLEDMLPPARCSAASSPATSSTLSGSGPATAW